MFTTAEYVSDGALYRGAITCDQSIIDNVHGHFGYVFFQELDSKQEVYMIDYIPSEHSEFNFIQIVGYGEEDSFYGEAGSLINNSYEIQKVTNLHPCQISNQFSRLFFDFYCLDFNNKLGYNDSQVVATQRHNYTTIRFKNDFRKLYRKLPSQFITEGTLRPWKQCLKANARHQFTRIMKHKSLMRIKQMDDEYIWNLFWSEVLRAALYEEVLIFKEEKEKKEELQQKRNNYLNSAEYKEKQKEEWESFKANSNNVIKFVETENGTDILIKNYNDSNYTNLNQFFGMIYDDNFWNYYNKYVKFTNDALGVVILLCIGEMLFNIIPSLFGSREGMWPIIDIIVPVGIFAFWYYKGLEERYKLGWLIYLRNNWYDVADDNQRACILAAIMLAGTSKEVQRYMMANVNERLAINPQPPNNISHVLINDNIWDKVNKRGRNKYEG